MKKSWTCLMGGHRWHQLPGEPGGVSRQCEKCGTQERVSWVYMGPGTGLGVLHGAPSGGADELRLIA